MKYMWAILWVFYVVTFVICIITDTGNSPLYGVGTMAAWAAYRAEVANEPR